LTSSSSDDKPTIERLRASTSIPNKFKKIADSLEENYDYSIPLTRWSKEVFAKGREMDIDYDTIMKCVILTAKERGYSNHQISNALREKGFKISPSKLDTMSLKVKHSYSYLG
jgi:hypothetical protein